MDPARSDAGRRRTPRPYIGMHFTCCNVYVRIYLNRAGTAFTGFCPRCGAKASLKASPDGDPSKFWSTG